MVVFCFYVATLHIALLSTQCQQWDTSYDPDQFVGSGIIIQQQIVEFLLPDITELIISDPGLQID